MANYKEIQGFPIQNLTTDPTPYAQALADNPYVGAWSSGGSLNTARRSLGGSGTSFSNSIAFGGQTGAPAYTGVTETYDGSSWTEVADLNTARRIRSCATQGTSTATLGFGGYDGTNYANTESWNGSAWTEVADLNTARRSAGGAGIQTAALIAGGTATVNTTNVESWNGSAWTEVADLSSARSQPMGVGLYTAALMVGGNSPAPAMLALNESWNGSSWTELADINTARQQGSSGGLQTSALVFAGNAPPTVLAVTESWDGSSWTEVADMATARYLTAGSGTNNTVSLVFGGRTPTVVANTEEWTFSGLPPSTPAAGYSDAIIGQMYYNSTTGQFKAIKDGGAPIGTWASGGTLNNGGGENAGAGTQTASIVMTRYRGASSPFGITETYDGTSWTEVADVPVSNLYNGMGSGTQTAAFYMGGQTASRVSTVYEWDGSSWTSGTAFNTARTNGGAGGTTTATVLFGGSVPPNTGATELWNGSSWTEVNDMNTARAGHGGAGVSTSAIAMGANPAATNTEIWDGTNWTEVSELNTGRGLAGSSGLLGTNNVLFAGGNPGTSKTEAWDGSAWTETGDLATTRWWITKNASTTAGFAVGGENPAFSPYEVSSTEEFSFDDFQIKTLTTS